MAFTTIAKVSDHFDCPTWDGSNSTTTVTGMGFKPDALLIKRYDGSGHPLLNNSSEGTGQNWIPSGNNANNTTVHVASYTSDGFTLTGNINDTNDASQKYMAACWKINAGTESTNTSGSISAEVQVNQTAGISICRYTGTGANGTIGHGLGAIPKLIIGKSTTVADRGDIFNGGTTIYSDTETDLIQFAGTGAFQDDAGGWNDTKPTSSVWSIGNKTHHNTSGAASVAYCFAEIQGFSKFGFYIGNGNSSGVKIYCGFRPKWIMVKNWGQTEDWFTKVSGLTGFGLGGQRTRTVKISDNTSSTNCTVNFESNGFRITTTDGKANTDGGKYIYMAFAEMPMVGTNGTIALAI
ncbi:hypothetical protein [uncultured phage_MedDCM-OCT-S28-C10]|uniref:DUF7483 domain-containing protein n=1 Tax=uncultured phage_MedDCM-OCT-S28-C10 TaxID=2741077 RepID=A0A6S4PFX6_9CAUD|nr:tail fiber protein [uncultured phage_MedDCM-OCT-S28-C10]BAQ94053.1 hypothetical protein [uncultured phage_MedDCM-OCT-S28-C10]